MIRVIYQWDIEPERLKEFETIWRRTTRSIHDSTAGALGSFCLQSAEDPRTVLTVALWEHEEQWKRFIETARGTSMKDLHAIGTQISATAYHQIGDETVTVS